MSLWTSWPISNNQGIAVPVWIGETGPGDVESEHVGAFSSQRGRFLQDCARTARQLWSLHEAGGHTELKVPNVGPNLGCCP